MKTLAYLIALALVSGMVALAFGAARIHPGITWAGVTLLGAGFAGLYFSP